MTVENLVKMVVSADQIGEAQDTIHEMLERDAFNSGLPDEEVIAKATTIYMSFLIAIHTGVESMYATAFETDNPRLSANDLMDQMLENSKSFMEEYEKKRRSQIKSQMN